MTPEFLLPLFFWGAVPLLLCPQQGERRPTLCLAAGLLLLAAGAFFLRGGGLLEMLLWGVYISGAALTPVLVRHSLRSLRDEAEWALSEMKQLHASRQGERAAVDAQHAGLLKSLSRLQDRFALVQVMATKMDAPDMLQALGNAWRNVAGVRSMLIFRRRPNGNWDLGHDGGGPAATEWLKLLNDHPDFVNFHQVRRYTAPEKHPLLRDLSRRLEPPFLLVPFVWEQEVLALGYVETESSLLEACAEDLDAETRFVSLGLRRAHLYELLSERSRHDALTGAYLRSVLQERLRESVRRKKRYQSPFFCALLDIDHFKTINDRWGHLAGDRALQHLTETVRRLAPPGVFLARYGGDEFALILEMETLQAAARWLEELRRTVEEASLPTEQGVFRYTLSIGLCTPSADAAPEAIVEQADRGLYQAKNAGRNRVAITAKE